MNGQAILRLNANDAAAALKLMIDQEKRDAIQRILHSPDLLAQCTAEHIAELMKAHPDIFTKWEKAVNHEFMLIGRHIIDTIAQVLRKDEFSRKKTCAVMIAGDKKYLKYCPLCKEHVVPFNPITREEFTKRHTGLQALLTHLGLRCRHEVPVSMGDLQIISNMLFLQYN